MKAIFNTSEFRRTIKCNWIPLKLINGISKWWEDWNFNRGIEWKSDIKSWKTMNQVLKHQCRFYNFEVSLKAKVELKHVIYKLSMRILEKQSVNRLKGPHQKFSLIKTSMSKPK